MKIPRTIKRPKFFILLLTIGLVSAYTYSFASWWRSGSVQLGNVDGHQIQRVELRMTSFRWRTIYLWMPAILFMEHVIGYRMVRQVAAGEDSIYVYQK